MNISRRSILTGLSLLAAPAVIKIPGLLMPVKSINFNSSEYPIGWYQDATIMLSGNIVYVFAVKDTTDNVIHVSNDGGVTYKEQKLNTYKILNKIT